MKPKATFIPQTASLDTIKNTIEYFRYNVGTHCQGFCIKRNIEAMMADIVELFYEQMNRLYHENFRVITTTSYIKDGNEFCFVTFKIAPHQKW